MSPGNPNPIRFINKSVMLPSVENSCGQQILYKSHSSSMPEVVLPRTHPYLSSLFLSVLPDISHTLHLHLPPSLSIHYFFLSHFCSEVQGLGEGSVNDEILLLTFAPAVGE